MMNLSCQSYLNNKTFIRISGFGMTESSPVTHFQPAEGAILGGCGVPIPNTIAKIIDLDSGKALGPNQVGIGIYWLSKNGKTLLLIFFFAKQNFLIFGTLF